MLRHVFVAGLALAFLGFAELPPPSSDIPTTAAPRRGTVASRAFCEAKKGECHFDPTEPERITLTPEIFARIEAINVLVNKTIKPVSDEEHWGVTDRWDYPDDGRGDCEDIQLEKRRRLTWMGLPKRALLMAVVVDHDGNGHAVLIVRTDRGDYVLDNLTPAVLPWSDTDLDFRQREDGRGGWIDLNGHGAAW